MSLRFFKKARMLAMTKKIHISVITFLVAFSLVLAVAYAAPGGNQKPVPATVESASASYEIFLDSPSDQQLEATTYPEIRRISITIQVTFGDGDSDQEVEILARTASGDDFPIRTFRRSDFCCQIIETLEFNSDGWVLQAWKNDTVGAINPIVDYTATTIH